MKKVLLLTSVGLLCLFSIAQAQSNIFNPNDLNRRWVNNGTNYSNDSLSLTANPNPNIFGIQKWVSVKTSGVDSNAWGKDYKAYFINLNGTRLPFRIKYPKSFSNPDSAGKKYPIMLFFHGAGEPGCPANGGLYNNEKQMVHGGQRFRNAVEANTFDGFLLYPQTQVPTNGCWSDWGVAPYSPSYITIISMIDSLAKYARADVDRVLVDGLSNGGVACWSITSAYPQRVTKAAPSAAASAATNYAEFVHIPIWFATGGKDTNPSPSYAASTYNGVNNIGGDIRWTLYPDLGHFVWNNHWSEPDFFSNMNDMHKANPLVFFKRFDYCPDSAINSKIGITAGFYAYEWQKDGVTIATSTNGSHTIINGSSIISYTGNEITVNSFGTYRVRFKRLATSDWSVYSPKPAVIFPKTQTITPPITVSGLRSKVLPALDGSTTVPLTLPSGYFGYEWRRVGDNVVVSTSNNYNAPIGQYSAKIIEQFGCGSASSPIFTVIDKNGSPKPEAAKNLSAFSSSIGSIQLDWNENPNAGQNESGYEIYRATASGGPYKLIAITAPDVVTYNDVTIAGNTQYYYIVRAVSDFGAAPNSNEASVVTQVDNIAPSVPTGLTLSCASRTNVNLKWTASTDNLQVTKYDVYVNGVKLYTTTNTYISINELTPRSTYSFFVKAKDAAGNVSQSSNQVTANTILQGVCYKYFNIAPGLVEIPNYGGVTPADMGTVTQLVARQSNPNISNFGYVWEGYIYIATGGSYRFQTCSDDGSKFFFNMPYNHNAVATVNNDGLHGPNTCVTSASIALTAGTYYPIAASFFENSGGDSMSLRWSLGTAAFTTVPVSAFTEATAYTPPGTAPNAPSGLSASAVAFNRINLTWTDNSTNETGFEVTRSTSSGGTYLPIGTVTTNSFADSTVSGSTAYFYRVRSINNFGASAFTTTASATTPAGPAAPAAPTSLNGILQGKTAIQLTWNDNSTNETGFEIYRSVTNQANYRLIKTVAGGAGATKNFTDSGLFANTQYFYVIKAIGVGGSSANSNVANLTTLNTKPELSHVLDFTMKHTTSFTIRINAVDGDADPLSFSFDNLPYYTSIQPVSNGNIDVTFSPTIGDQGAFTVAVFVDDGFGGRDTTYFSMAVNDNTVPVMVNITDKVVNEGGEMIVPVRVDDVEGNQNISWYYPTMPSFGTFVDSGNGRGAIVLKPGYAASGVYIMTIFGDDGNGAWDSKTFQITVNEVDPNETVRVNFKFYTGNVPTWNDVDLGVLPSPFNRPGLLTIKGVPTTIGINALATHYTASAQGFQTGNNSGTYPDLIMRDYLSWGLYDFGVSDTLGLRVYGLDTARRYNFVFFGSSLINCCGIDNNSVTTYKIGNQTATVAYYLNSNNTDTIYQIKPNATGEIFISMIGDAATLKGGMLNALIIDAAFDDGSTPVKPLNPTGYFTPNLGAQLNWEDKSYNEFSYGIYRATSKTGPYTLLNPGMSNKDSVTYKDATAAQFSTYYYYIAGSNNNGVGASSDTITVFTENNLPAIVGLDNFRLKAGASFAEDFSVSDAPSDILTVSIKNKPSFITLTTLSPGNYRITANPSNNNIGQHYLDVVAKDDKGGETIRQIIVTVNDNSVRSFFVNFGDFGKVAPAPWNNFLHYGGQGQTINGLLDEAGVASTLSMTLTHEWSSRFLTGLKTGNNSGVVSDTVLSGGLFYTGTNSRTITINGLAGGTTRYNIVVVSSRNEGVEARMRISSGTVSDTVDGRYNTTMTANLNRLAATSGAITINFNKLTTAANSAMYLNAIIIEEYDNSVAIVSPVNLYVEPRTMTSTVLTWSDRSNNENSADGFQLQRASDSLFTAGVTTFDLGNNNSTYTNTGLTANTKYWYRIRAKTGTSTFSGWSNQVKTITPQSLVYINFNQNVQNAANPWNNMEEFPSPGTSYANLKNQVNVNTGYTLTITKTFNGENNAGMSTGNNTGMGGLVPDVVMQSSYWIDQLQEAQVRISGLNQNKRYRVGFISSSNWIGGDLTATLTINGRTVYINSWQNTTKIVYIGDLVADENGDLLLNISTSNDAANAYSSGFILSAYDDVNGGGVINQANQNGLDKKNIAEEQGDDPILFVQEGEKVDITVYPNPFVETINLDFANSNADNTIGVDVYDLSGQLVMKRSFGKMPLGPNTLRINTAEGKMATGVYLVTLTVNGKTAGVSKLIKTKN